MNYNNQLLTFAQEYNKAKANADNRIAELQANIGNVYSPTYIFNETEKVKKDFYDRYIGKAEELLNTITKEKTKAVKNAHLLKYPSLKNDPGAFEMAYSNAQNFLSAAKKGVEILDEAEEALMLGRTAFCFILMDELSKRSKKNIDPQYSDLVAKAEILKENYFRENGIDYKQALNNAAELTANEWDILNIVNDVKSGFASIYPYRIFNQVSNEVQSEMQAALDSTKDITKKILYSQAMRNGQFQTL